MTRAIVWLGLLVAAAGCRRPEPPACVDLWIGGDVHLGTGTTARPPLAPLAPLTEGALGIVNLEGVVTSPATESRNERLVNDAAALPSLFAAGVRVAAIANNHAFDLGPDGPSRTAAALRESGIEPAGLNQGPAVIRAGDLRVVIAAFDLSAGIPADLAASLTAARDAGDILVVTFHVTGPPSYLPRPELRDAVESALAAHASVVAAHGTHALGPVERRGDGVIAWGLGNLTFACDCSREREGALLRVSIPPSGPVAARIIPIRAGIDGGSPIPDPEAELAFDLLEALGSSPLTRQGAFASF